MRLFDRGITRLSALGCVALVAATLSSAQDADGKPSAQPASTPASSSHASTSSHTTTSKSTHTSAHSTTGKSKKSRKSASKGHTHGQQKIDSKRTLEIQEALIREHYLDGKPTGVWNDATQQAMQKYQADNNWQSKTTPDARALIKLGLGPDHDHLLNPESAMTSQPQARPSTPGTAAEPDKQQR
ncbi:MAG TPA: putative peptidoglycan binding domain-containing protein [Terriglobales bacterium]|nr:putative peptidoglycan binding domain-containing protein [Terriglobales bacterium]